jgi:hypothetical protein
LERGRHVGWMVAGKTLLDRMAAQALRVRRPEHDCVGDVDVRHREVR